MSSKGFDATIVSPYPVSGGGSKSCGDGGGCEGNGLAGALDVFRRFFGLLGAEVSCDDSEGGLKSGGHIPGPGNLYGAIPKLCVILLIYWIAFVFGSLIFLNLR